MPKKVTLKQLWNVIVVMDLRIRHEFLAVQTFLDLETAYTSGIGFSI